MMEELRPLHWFNSFISLASTILYCYMVPVSVFGALAAQSNKGTRIRAAWESFLHPSTDFTSVFLHSRFENELEGAAYPILYNAIQPDCQPDFTTITRDLSEDDPSSDSSLDSPISSEDALCPSDTDDDDAQTTFSSPGGNCTFAARSEHTPGGKHALDKASSNHSHSEFVANAPHTTPNEMINISLPTRDEVVEELVESSYPSNEVNEILRLLRRDARNIVLDSLNPHIAPHIVVSPPDTCWEDFNTPFHNRIESQSLALLAVPRLSASIFQLSRPPHIPDPSFHNWSSHLDQSLLSSTEQRIPRRRRPLSVFSPSKFSRVVLSSSTERLIFRHIVDAIHRHRYKAAAYEACEAALAVCERFSGSNSASQFEKPFVWTDPAQTVLSLCRLFHGTMVFESDCPFIAPHIMVSEPPPQSPWISWGNGINPQNFDQLSVFSNCTPVMTSDNTIEIALSDCGADHECNASTWGLHLFSEDSDGSDSDNYSREETSSPVTPPHGDEFGSVHVNDSQDTRETERNACSAGLFVLDREEACSALYSRTMSAGLSQSRCETPTPDSDNEDDLPPFDDWYISVVERSKHIVG